MKKILSILFLPLLSFGQGDQAIIKVPISAIATEQAILHLPDDYGTTTINYPLLVFLHGAGEGGANASLIYNNASAGGPAYFITQKIFPSSFVNPADGKSYKFIVVSPQYIAGWSSSPQMLEYILTYLLKTYRVDASRIYLTGLSAGGEGILEYIGKIDGTGAVVNATHPIAAFVPMSAVMNAAYRPRYAQTIVSDRVGIWGFGSPTDTHGANTLSLVTWDIQHNVQAGYGTTTSYAGGHCCWGKFYNPAFTQGGINIYQWMLQYTTNAVQPPPPVIVPPVKTIIKVMIYYSDGSVITQP